ncbi:hypothetical protein JTB14_016365 [Gonioctena quinquepunctata]|nr:hypothetical protein JTB14_016365 [Gonioctena quinquepunctata]
MAGMKKAQHVNTAELWSKDGTTPDFFAAVMSKRRFHLLVQAIRFDNMDTRHRLSEAEQFRDTRHLEENIAKLTIWHLCLFSVSCENLNLMNKLCQFWVQEKAMVGYFGNVRNKLCSRHFDSSDITIPNTPCGRATPRKNAVPKCFLRNKKPPEHPPSDVTSQKKKMAGRIEYVQLKSVQSGGDISNIKQPYLHELESWIFGSILNDSDDDMRDPDYNFEEHCGEESSEDDVETGHSTVVQRKRVQRGDSIGWTK